MAPSSRTRAPGIYSGGRPEPLTLACARNTALRFCQHPGIIKMPPIQANVMFGVKTHPYAPCSCTCRLRLWPGFMLDTGEVRRPRSHDFSNYVKQLSTYLTTTRSCHCRCRYPAEQSPYQRRQLPPPVHHNFFESRFLINEAWLIRVSG